ncbi:MAG: hypothetical protein AAF490_19435 [Chloroflexota bacterium]
MKTVQILEQTASTQLSKQKRRYKLMSLWFLALPIVLFFLFYTMSDGFTDSQDSLGALLVNLVLLLPFLAFFGMRYLSTQRVSELKDVAVRHYLPKVITSLQSNQKAELILIGLMIGLAIVGVLLTILFETAVSPWLIGGALALAIGLGFNSWRAFELQKGEINGYIEQLTEISQADAE